MRQLLVVLCERGELQQLVQFPYIDLESDVVAILESRARSVDLTSHNYYDLLYAFHVFRNNYRKGKKSHTSKTMQKNVDISQLSQFIETLQEFIALVM